MKLLLSFALCAVGLVAQQTAIIPTAQLCPAGKFPSYTIISSFSTYTSVLFTCIDPPPTGIPDIFVYCVSGTCKSVEYGNFVVYHNVPPPSGPGPCIPQGNYPSYAIDSGQFIYYCPTSTTGQSVWLRSATPLVSTW